MEEAGLTIIKLMPKKCAIKLNYLEQFKVFLVVKGSYIYVVAVTFIAVSIMRKLDIKDEKQL